MSGAEIVLADGTLTRADDDLLWAIRGAGGNFGIVTEFALDAYPLGNVIYAAMAPCMRLYAWLGQSLDADSAGPYAEWVRTYA